jgi:type II secretory pathway pseudopilin PulG
MNPRIEQLICPLRPEGLPPVSYSPNRGYAFLVLMMIVTILLISLTAALPSIYTAGQREKEEELIFRGNEYARAILFFHRQFGRFPSSVDEILKKTNGYRFLRRAYRDPMSPNGKWRLIHANAAGMLIDSRTMPGVGRQGNQAGQTPPGATTPGMTFPGTAPPGTTPLGEQPPQVGEGDNSIFTNQTQGAFIVGVASSSTKNSIRVLNDQTHYDRWEFLAVGPTVGGLQNGGGTGSGIGQGGVTTTPVGPNQNPGMGPGQGIPPLTDQPVFPH